MACHRAPPNVILLLPASGPGRGIGARIERGRPASHSADFVDKHGPLAGSSPGTCSACHERAECLECHRPNAGAAGNYHPAGFLTRHPAAAFNREAASEAMRRTARALGSDDAATALYDLMLKAAPTHSLKEMGLTRAALEKAADLAVKDPYDNPRLVTRDGLLELLAAAHDGGRPRG